MRAFDDLDFGILRELWAGRGPYFRSDRASLEAVARALGVHHSTVAARVDRWASDGVLQGWTLDVDPSALGLVGAQLHLRAAAPDAERALETAALVDGVQLLVECEDRWVVAPTFADTPAALDRTERLLAAVLEAREVRRESDTRVDYPDAAPVPLTEVDARVLLALLDDARRPVRDVAAAAGVTPRTVQRRLDRLREEGVCFVMPRLRFERIGGAALGMLSFRLPAEDRDAAVDAILRAAPDHVIRDLGAAHRGQLGVHAATRQALAETARRVAAVPGVGDVTLRLLRASREPPGFRASLGERIRRHAGLPAAP